MASGRRVAGGISSLFNVKGLQLQHAKVLHETLLIPVLIYGREIIMIWKEERSRIRVVQMHNLRGLLGIRRMDSPECMDKGVLQS